ncbi:aminotransferase class III-fold pyridoxal phosphate-dependent enzyme [Thermomicrobiaceae bacterium CFH 74404]|uniref:Aminotransferase class III-fold pyridoxal phosphate-dependent enzyme n=1 Tax=Thermalbibacter longus TaxID=2951981 RepID=A0AA41WEJ9_9BACT|nr:aminotransferase class III-fold pyridoxal phosphate-dependent enzyme [Thermalbibacter longus]MCM8748595.1 aminotransferase class III-fold pyridoxal phosphate-dependent enzyme [Thermalbibacter longus]
MAATELNPQEIIPRVLTRYSPVVVDRAEGLYLWDIHGERWADFTSGIAVVNTGHCHPKVVAAIREQAGKIIHAQANILAHEPMMRLAQAITATMPPKLNQVFFSNSGAEAVEGAVKLAKAATGRPAIIAFRGAFHGRTHLAMALTSSRVKVRGHYEPLVPSIYYAPYPYPFRNPYGVPPDEVDLVCLAELERLFETMVMPDDVAAIIVEPMLGEGGYILPPKRFLQNLRRLCDQYGILLIADEIQTGVGRTGRMWAFEHFEIVPDIVTVAKGIASGLPLSAVVANRELMDKWAPGAHGGTYGGNAVACAAGVATFEVMREERLPENAERVGNFLMAQLRELQDEFPVIGEVRGLGLMIGVEFVKPDRSPNPDAVKRVIQRAQELRTLLITAGEHDQVIRVIPPLIISQRQAEEFLDVFAEAVKSAS